MDKTKQEQENDSGFTIDSDIIYTITSTLMFVILKVCGVIDWGWQWVLIPLWLPILLGIVLIIAGSIAMLIGNLLGRKGG